MIKVKHLKTGRLYDLLGKGKMKVNGEWVDSYTYGGIDKTTGEMGVFTRDKEDFESHFKEYIENEIWNDGLTTCPVLERSIYDPVVYLIDNSIYLSPVGQEKYFLNEVIRRGEFKWAYKSELIKYFKSKKLPKYISDNVEGYLTSLIYLYL